SEVDEAEEPLDPPAHFLGGTFGKVRAVSKEGLRGELILSCVVTSDGLQPETRHGVGRIRSIDLAGLEQAPLGWIPKLQVRAAGRDDLVGGVRQDDFDREWARPRGGDVLGVVEVEFLNGGSAGEAV